MWRDASELSIKAKSKTYFYQGEVAAIRPAELQRLIDEAALDPMKKARLCVHSRPESPIHNMIIASHRSTYVGPHRHDHSSVFYTMIQGAMRLIIFDEQGHVKEWYPLEAGQPDVPQFARIESGIWHAEVYMSEWSLFSESVLSPSGKENVLVPAPWGPGANEQAKQDFMDQMRAF